jgi:hypothetical protein
MIISFYYYTNAHKYMMGTMTQSLDIVVYVVSFLRGSGVLTTGVLLYNRGEEFIFVIVPCPIVFSLAT